MQVIFDDEEYERIRQAARRQGQSLAEWVRQALRSVYRQQPQVAGDRRLAAVRAAVQHEFPTADIDEMLAEIEQGYETGPSR
jgi:hypothetical protein